MQVILYFMAVISTTEVFHALGICQKHIEDKCLGMPKEIFVVLLPKEPLYFNQLFPKVSTEAARPTGTVHSLGDIFLGFFIT